MQFIEFKQKLKKFLIFSLQDIRKIAPNFDHKNLTYWQKKGYISRIKQGFYMFTDQDLDESRLFVIANKIYSPSYVSLESALSYYHLIPETVYSVTSVTTKKTSTFNTALGQFAYQTVKPELFFGYQLVAINQKTFKIAGVEKLLLDYLYLRPELNIRADFEELRINQEELKNQLNQQKLAKYLKKFNQKSLSKRVQILLSTYKL